MTTDGNSKKLRVGHKFRGHQIDPHTKILIIGTFNPNTLRNNADFFIAGK
jgi:hypothetical protein